MRPGASEFLIPARTRAEQAGMQTCLVRPDGRRPDEDLPDEALLISHVAELPTLLEPL